MTFMCFIRGRTFGTLLISRQPQMYIFLLSTGSEEGFGPLVRLIFSDSQNAFEVRNIFSIEHFKNVNVGINHRFIPLMIHIPDLIQNFNNFIVILPHGIFFRKIEKVTVEIIQTFYELLYGSSKTHV
jgi:hypothetical protein